MPTLNQLLIGDGNKVAYYRIGNESAPAPAAILNELILKGRHQTYDALTTNYQLSDYSYTIDLVGFDVFA